MLKALFNALRKLVHLVFVAFTLSCGLEQTKDKVVPPNVVIIMTDDQGWGDLSLTGNLDISTPHIDALANTGAFFSNFYVSPVCSPTRAELLTGRYAARGGVYSTSAGGERLDLDETTIADVFLANGYSTAAFGKWHNGMQFPYHPNGRGFEEFYGFCSGHWGNYFDPVLEHNGEIIRGEGFIIDDLTNKAIDYIEENKSKPFFVYLPLNTPHSPMQVPDKFWDKFKNLPLIATHDNKGIEDLDHTRAALAMGENIDWNVGRVMEQLDLLGLRENTIVVYLSDNGPNGYRWNAGMRGIKGSTDEGGVRSPLIISWPGKIAPDQQVVNIGSIMDLLPTLIDMCGLKWHSNKPLDGQTLSQVLLNNSPEFENRSIVSHWQGNTSVRNQQFRLDASDRLYNMTDDPEQAVDVSSTHPQLSQALIAQKANWHAEVLTELPSIDNRSFPVGHPDFKYNQLPARDAKVSGQISRSNRWPNCSYYTNWIDMNDSIYWDIEVLADGLFVVEMYYTCKAGDEGLEIALSMGEHETHNIIEEAYDPPAYGGKDDRVPRVESYVKDFKPFNLGTIALEAGKGSLVLKTLTKPGNQSIDLRLITLTRIDNEETL